jgi:hypothetical protein
MIIWHFSILDISVWNLFFIAVSSSGMRDSKLLLAFKFPRPTFPLREYYTYHCNIYMSVCVGGYNTKTVFQGFFYTS